MWLRCSGYADGWGSIDHSLGHNDKALLVKRFLNSYCPIEESAGKVRGEEMYAETLQLVKDFPSPNGIWELVENIGEWCPCTFSFPRYNSSFRAQEKGTTERCSRDETFKRAKSLQSK